MIELLNTEIHEEKRWVESRLERTKMRIGENIQNKTWHDKMENTTEEKREKMRSKLYLGLPWEVSGKEVAYKEGDSD